MAGVILGKHCMLDTSRYSSFSHRYGHGTNCPRFSVEYTFVGPLQYSWLETLKRFRIDATMRDGNEEQGYGVSLE